MSNPPIVQLVDVSTGYRQNPVFAHLSLTLEHGIFAGVIGPTGSGKTTLLKTILGTLAPHGGEVLVCGRHLRELPRGTVGYVPQLETVDWSFPVTVEQVIMMGLFLNRTYLPWATREERKQVAELAEKLGISNLLKSHIRNLSGGQQQRTFLARALISNPKLLVLDEPTSGVDIKTQHDVLHLLHHLNEDGISIVITTHDLNAVAAHLPWVICFNNKVVASGKPNDVFTSAILSATYGGELDVIRSGDQLLIAHAHHHKH